MSIPRVHLLHLAHGDLFRFDPEGGVFRVIVELDEKGKPKRYMAQPADMPEAELIAAMEWEDCFVYRVEPEGGEDE